MADPSRKKDALQSFRHCPSCGAKGIVIRADRSVRCRKCGYHLYLNVAAAVAGFIEDDIGRLLMIVRGQEPAKGTLDLPGGFVDINETAEDALKREVREELNLDVKRCVYFGSFPNTYPFGGIIVRTLDLAFVCTVESFTGQRCSGEIAEVRFLKPREIDPNDIGFDSIRAMVASYLRARRSGASLV